MYLNLMKNRIVGLALLCLWAVSWTSCSKDKDDKVHDLVGRWEISTVKAAAYDPTGKIIPGSEQDVDLSALPAKPRLDVKADGTCTLQGFEGLLPGMGEGSLHYTIAGNKLVVTLGVDEQGKPIQMELTFNVAGNVLTLIVEEAILVEGVPVGKSVTTITLKRIS